MKLQSLVLLIILAMIAAFSALNWGVFLAPTELWLGFTSVQMPLGLLMLGLLVFITLLFLVFVVYLQGSVLLEARRHSRELQTNRALADGAEASRFTELRTFIEKEMTRQSGLNGEASAAVLARIDKLEHDFRTITEQTGNTLAAYIGELEDRLEKSTTLPPAR